MTTDAVNLRLQQLLNPIWSFQQIKEWYGIDASASQSFLAQYRIWAETFREDQNAVIMQGSLNRFYLELFLQHRGLVGVRAAAIQLGMDVDSLRATLNAAKNANLITDQEAVGAFPNAHVYLASFISEFYSRFPALAKFTFSSYSSFCRRFHKEIKEVLNVPVKPALCVTSLKLQEDSTDFGRDLDAITEEPIGLGFKVWINTNKPIQLKPDYCSWLTYARFEGFLKDYADMGKDAEFEKYRDELKK